jgi:hypothetical protein
MTHNQRPLSQYIILRDSSMVDSPDLICLNENNC